MKILIFLMVLILTGCSAKQMIKYKKDACTSQNKKYQIITDENYKIIDIKCEE